MPYVPTLASLCKDAKLVNIAVEKIALFYKLKL